MLLVTSCSVLLQLTCRGKRIQKDTQIVDKLGENTCIHSWSFLTGHRVIISVRVRESTLAKTHANKSTRVQLDSRKLSDVSHKLNTGESKDSCKLHPGESKWTLVALYKISTPVGMIFSWGHWSLAPPSGKKSTNPPWSDIFFDQNYKGFSMSYFTRPEVSNVRITNHILW